MSGVECYWTYSVEGQKFDCEFESLEKCTSFMEEEFAQNVFETESLANGETRSADAEIIQFKYGEDGEKETVCIEKFSLEYEHYHGDLAEHGTY